jgi:hypothetical protein
VREGEGRRLVHGILVANVELLLVDHLDVLRPVIKLRIKILLHKLVTHFPDVLQLG